MGCGFKEIDNGRKANLCLINTCTVTHGADRDSLQLIRRAIKENSRARIIVTGCLTELDSKKIASISPAIKIIRNSGKNRITRFLDKGTRAQGHKGTSKGISYFKDHTRAFLKIQEGCNNSCAYCKVPLVRGPSRSKPLGDIIQEVERLAQNGYKEIVLTGICLGSYGDLVNLIERLEKIEGLLRIRLSSIEAGDISDELINKMATSKKLSRHLHIPIQSGDDEILKKMNRHYNRADYLKLIRKIKKKIPGIALTTDCLIGFPGEEEKNFKNTLKLVKKIIPLKVHIFPYSKREFTPAASNFTQEMTPGIIKDRIRRLKEAADKYSAVYKKKFLNKNMGVLIEGRAKEDSGYWEGYTDNYIRVLVKSDKDLKNQFITLKLEKIFGDSMRGKLFLLDK